MRAAPTLSSTQWTFDGSKRPTLPMSALRHNVMSRPHTGVFSPLFSPMFRACRRLAGWPLAPS